ncbi:MAG TPA: metallopeptidase TldD-related protein [Thermoanaerobaculia bacterium]
MTTPVGERLAEVLERLAGRWDAAEVFHKTGRSRSVRYAGGASCSAFHQEEGWAARAGDGRRSFFYAATGAPRPDAPWPDADGRGLRLPPARLVPEWTPPLDLDASLLGENEAQAFFEGLDRELARELPGARLARGELDDGSSEAHLASSREVAARVRRRAATLYLEAVGPVRGGRAVTLRAVEREARRFQPLALARRLADRLAIGERGTAPARDRGEFLLAPPVVVSLLDALSPLWIGPGAVERIGQLVDRRGRVGSPALTLVDDGRLPGGVLSAPVDGEGQPTREVVLVQEGLFRQPLLAWWQATPSTGRASGCAARPGWRDLPSPGPTHFYLRPDPALRAAALVEGLSRGYYLLDVEGAPRLEEAPRRFALPVCGFAIDGGRPTGSVSGAWLVGTVTAFLNGILTAARDLTFLPSRSGLVGAPTLLVKGLELRRRRDRSRD